MLIKRYSESSYKQWNDFLTLSKLNHFMFHRDYMDYHSDRFNDHSLMIYDEKDKLIALFPANHNERLLYSHQGLSFGGFLFKKNLRASTILSIFDSLLGYCKSSKIEKLIYKKPPYIYDELANEEDLYTLYSFGAKLYRRDISSVIFMDNKLRYSKGRKYNISLAKKNALTVSETDDFSQFWSLLGSVLESQHGAKPVHSLDEISLLRERFPNNIRLFTAHGSDNALLGGTVIYSTSKVAHVQYMANSFEGRQCGALDFIIDTLINEQYSHMKYFDFGISTEDNGMYLNQGLIEQKEGFGARGICHDFYSVDI